MEIPSRMEDNFQPNLEALEAAITPRTKAILIGYPNNPTGAVASRETLLEVLRIAEKHDLVVISDEIYDRLVYGVAACLLCGAAGSAEAHHHAGRFLEGLCHDRLADRVCRWHRRDRCRGCCASTNTRSCLPRRPPRQLRWKLCSSGESYVQDMIAEYDRRRKLIVGGLNQLGLPTFEPLRRILRLPEDRVDRDG